MSKLIIDVSLNSSDFIEKTEQIRSAIRATAHEVEQQGRKISDSFQQMADSAGVTTSVVGEYVKDMCRQVDNAINTLDKIGLENQLRLSKLSADSKNSTFGNDESIHDDPFASSISDEDSLRMEISSRENLSEDIDKQHAELIQLKTELLSCADMPEQVQNDLSTLRAGFRQVHENAEQKSEMGLENTEVAAVSQDEAHTLTNDLEAINERASQTTTSKDVLEGMASGLNGFADACASATSMLELFSAKNEYLQTIMLKVQTAMSMVNGLKEVSIALDKESAFQINVVGKLKLWMKGIAYQAAAAQGVQTASTLSGTLANLGLAGSFRAIGLAIQSIPVIGWILAGITALTGLYSWWSSKTEKQRLEQEELNKSISEFNNSVQQHATKPVTLIESLAAKFKALGSDIQAQEKFVINNKKAFDELGVSIRNVKEAQQLLIDNKSDFVNAQIAKAISLTYEDKMQEEAKNYIEAADEAFKWQNEVDKYQGNIEKIKSGKDIMDGQEIITRNYNPELVNPESGIMLENMLISNNQALLNIAQANLNASSDQIAKSEKKMNDLATKAFLYSQQSDQLMAKFRPKEVQGVHSNDSKEDRDKIVNEKKQALLDTDNKQALEQMRLAEDIEIKRTQARINAMDDGAQKTLAQMQLNHKKELQELTREGENLLRKKIDDAKAAFNAEEAYNQANDSKYEKKTFNAASVKLSESERENFASREKDLMKQQINEIEKYYSTLRGSYQDYTDKRLAIEKKYNDDIAALQASRARYLREGNMEKVEQTDRSIGQATKKKGEELMQADYEQLKKSPEYVRAFENLKNTSTETLNSLLNQLESAKQKAAAVLSPDQLKDYTTSIQSIMAELDERNPFQALAEKKEELAYAEEELARAQLELNDARQQAQEVKDGKKIEVTSTKFNNKTGKIETVKSYLSESQAIAKVTANTENLSAAKDKVREKSNNVKEAEKKVTDQINGLSKSIGELGAAIGGPAGEIITLIGDIGTFTMTAMSGVKAAADTSANAISTVEKASVILAIISAAVQLATKVASLFMSKDGEQYEAMKSSYESLIKVWDTLIDRKMEYISVNTGEEAAKAGEEALNTLNKQIKATKQLALERLKVTNKSHSMEYRMWQGSYKYDGQNWKDVAREIEEHTGKAFSSMRDLTNMSAEDLIWIQENYSGFWSKMDDDFKEQLETIIGYKEKEKEILDTTNQSLTQTTFDSVRDNFLDALTDMDSSSEDFANSFSKYMQKAILNSMLTKNYEGRLKKWYQDFADANKEGGIDEKEYETLQNDWNNIVADALEERNILMNQFGLGAEGDSSQSSTQKGFASMSQDTGEELNGRFTALQISNEEIKNSMLFVLGSLSSLCTTASDGNVLLMEMRNLAVMSNGHLEDIAKHTKVLLGFGAKLDNIDRNTQKI